MTKLWRLAIALLVLAVPSWGLSQHDESKGGGESEKLSRYSVVVAPYHLALPVLSGSFEARMGQNFGVGLAAGGGGFKGSTLVEGGLRAHAYPTGDFEGGVQLGLDVRYVGMPTGEAPVRPEEAIAREAVAISPFGGYIETPRLRGRHSVVGGVTIGGKYSVLSRGGRQPVAGLTIEGGLNLGAQWMFGPSTYDRHSSKSSYVIVAPRLYLNLGWTF